MQKQKRTYYVMCVAIVTVFFHSCSVYQPTEKTLSQLTEIDQKLMIKTKDNRALKFKRIILDRDKFYGIGRKEKNRVLVFEENIDMIKVYDKKALDIKTILVSTIGLGTFYLLVFGSDGDPFSKG